MAREGTLFHSLKFAVVQTALTKSIPSPKLTFKADALSNFHINGEVPGY